MTDDEVAHIARLLNQRNAIDDTIPAVIQRPMASGPLGEWIAAQVFDIQLEQSAVTAAIDGQFRSGPLQSRTVNVKWYLKQEGYCGYSPRPDRRAQPTTLPRGPQNAAFRPVGSTTAQP